MDLLGGRMELVTQIYGVMWMIVIAMLVVVFCSIAVLSVRDSRRKAADLDRRSKLHGRYDVSGISVSVNGYHGIITNMSLMGAGITLDEPISPLHQGPYVRIKLKSDDEVTIISMNAWLTKTQTYSMRQIHVVFDTHDALSYREELSALITHYWMRKHSVSF